MSEQLVNDFKRMVSVIENETQALKFLSSMRGAAHSRCPDDIKAKLKEIEGVVSSLENNLGDLDEFLDTELQSISRLQELEEVGNEQHKDIMEVKKNIPSFFKPSVLSDRTNTSYCATSVPMDEFDDSIIEKAEFEAVPKSTRSRLTLADTIQHYATIRKLYERKEETVASWKDRSKARKSAVEYKEYQELQSEDHYGTVFLLEKEIRSSSVFESGESTGRAVLHTLRSLHRLKLVRANGESTYILVKNIPKST